MNVDERETLHDIIIDLRKALMEDDEDVRAEVVKQIDRLYELMRVNSVG